MVYKYRADTPSPLASTDSGLKVANFIGYIFLFLLIAVIILVALGGYYYKFLDIPKNVSISLVKDLSLVKPVYPGDDDKKSWYYIPYNVSWNPTKYNKGYMVYVGPTVPLGNPDTVSEVVTLIKPQDVNNKGTTVTVSIPLDTSNPPDFIYTGVASNYTLLGGMYNIQSRISPQTNISKTPYANILTK